MHAFRDYDSAPVTGSSREVGIATSRHVAPVFRVARHDVTEPAELGSTFFAATSIFEKNITALAIFPAAILQRQRRGILRQENSTGYFCNRSTAGCTGTDLDRAPPGVRQPADASVTVYRFPDMSCFTPVIVWFETVHYQARQQADDNDGQYYRRHALPLNLKLKSLLFYLSDFFSRLLVVELLSADRTSSRRYIFRTG